MNPRAPLARALWLALAGCSTAAPGARDEAVDAAPRGPVVARVDGEPIGAEEVALTARDLGITPREALERAVQTHLLAREARRQGWQSPQAMRDDAWHARVQLLLAREVEQRVSDATLRPADVASVREQRAVELAPGPTVSVVHFLARLPPNPTGAARASARSTAEQFRARLVREAGERPTRAQFDAVAQAVGGENNLHEPVGPFDEQGRLAQGALVPAFAAAAFRLTASAPLSQPVETQFGVHVVLLVAEAGPVERPEAEVLAQVRRDMVVRNRSEAAYLLVERVRVTHSVQVSPESLMTVQSLARRREGP